jgi:hypothetical protein
MTPAERRARHHAELLPTLLDLHRAIAKELLARVEAGDAKASLLAVAVQFLSTNGIVRRKADDTPEVPAEMSLEEALSAAAGIDGDDMPFDDDTVVLFDAQRK